jgi:hypothetical protein
MRLSCARPLIFFDEVHAEGVLFTLEIPDLKDGIALVAFLANAERLKNSLSARFLVILTGREDAATARPEAGNHLSKRQQDLAVAQQVWDRIARADNDIKATTMVTAQGAHVADGKRNPQIARLRLFFGPSNCPWRQIGCCDLISTPGQLDALCANTT